MKKVSIALLSLSLGFVGCAHTTMRGSVAMKAGDHEAHICMGDKEVKAGDRVALFKNVCTGAARGGAKGGGLNGVCEMMRIGEGTVESTFNEHYSLLKVDPGVDFEEGTIVEKL